MRWWTWLLAGFVVLVLASGIFVFASLRNIDVEQIDDDLYVLFGMGGNVGVLNTDEGTVIIDTLTFQMQGERIRQIATGLTGKPVIAVINTHYHGDHTHGNPAFEAGTRVIATERTLHHLKQVDADYFAGEKAALLPNETFASEHRLTFGNKSLRLLLPGPGHTDGDLVVIFEQEQVIHLGDLLFNRLYPNIDLEAGGTVQKWGDTLDVVLTLPFDRVIPGHGAVTDRNGIRHFQTFIRQLAEIGQIAADNSLSLEETMNSDELTEDSDFEEITMIVPIGLNREFVLQRAWEEANGTVEVRP